MNRISQEILRLEHNALERWGQGDPDGYLAICAPEVVYFDPFLERSVVGFEALKLYYDSIRGKVSITRFEMIEPSVQLAGAIAVLSFRLDSWGASETALRWNATEVYRHDAEGFRIIHTHWSFTSRGYN